MRAIRLNNSCALLVALMEKVIKRCCCCCCCVSCDAFTRCNLYLCLKIARDFRRQTTTVNAEGEWMPRASHSPTMWNESARTWNNTPPRHIPKPHFIVYLTSQPHAGLPGTMKSIYTHTHTHTHIHTHGRARARAQIHFIILGNIIIQYLMCHSFQPERGWNDDLCDASVVSCVSRVISKATPELL